MQFKANDPRTRELGRKGGKVPHPNGTIRDHVKYRYKKFTIKWLKSKSLWEAISDNRRTKLYARSVAEIKQEINKDKAEHPDDYIEAKPEV